MRDRLLKDRAILLQDRAFMEAKEINIEGPESDNFIHELYGSDQPNYLETENGIENDFELET